MLVQFLNGLTTHETGRFLDARPGDVYINGSVVIDDLVSVIMVWGACARPCPAVGQCQVDMNGDCTVNIDDLVLVITNWD